MIHTLHDQASGDYLVRIVNEHNNTYYCHVTLTLIDYNGRSILNLTYERTVPPFGNVLVRRITKQEYPDLVQQDYISAQLVTT